MDYRLTKRRNSGQSFSMNILTIFHVEAIHELPLISINIVGAQIFVPLHNDLQYAAPHTRHIIHR